MRLALLVPSMEIGGVEVVFANLANGLREHGVEVDLVLGRAGGDLERLIKMDVHIWDLNCTTMIRCIPAIARYIRVREPNVLIAAMTHCTAAAVLARRIAQKKTLIVATEHNTMSQVIVNATGLKYRLMPLWSRWALNASDFIVAVSCGVADDLACQTRISREIVRVIYNPVITDRLYSSAAVAVDHPWFHPGGPPVILAVGRLDRQKDFTMLIRAFRVVRNYRNARLAILGEGPDRQGIEQSIFAEGLTKDVALPGFAQNPYPFMRKAAVFASSSAWEGFGVALVEALALGAPVVATDCPHGPSEILCKGKYGALVPVRDHEAMAQALLNALDKPPRYDTSGHLNQFTAQHVVSQYLSLVRR